MANKSRLISPEANFFSGPVLQFQRSVAVICGDCLEVHLYIVLRAKPSGKRVLRISLMELVSLCQVYDTEFRATRVED